MCLAFRYCLATLLVALPAFVPATLLAEDTDGDGVYEEVEDTPNKAKLWLMVGAYYPSLNTKVQISELNGQIGTRLDFESDLGMRDVALMPFLSASYRINSRHRLGLSYFDLKRQGSETSDVTLFIGDQEFSANLPITSFLDVKALSITYGYSLVTNPVYDLELSVGVSVQDLGLGFAQTQNQEEINLVTGYTVPLPTLGLSGFYAITDKWLLEARAGYFALDLSWDDNERNFGGHIVDASAGIYHKTFKNIGFGLHWSYFDVNVNYNRDSRAVRADYTYSGPLFRIVGYY